MNEQQIREQLINNIFVVYGKNAETERKQLYLALLKDIPTDVLKSALRKIYLEEKFMPSVAQIVDAAKSLLGSVDESKRVKIWQEAWKEIVKAMYKYPVGKEPEWSTPEIAQAVHSFGWIDLQMIEADKFTTASAQIRRYYEDACKRSKENFTNNYVLGMRDVKSLDAQRNGGVERLLGGNGIDVSPKE